MFNYQHTFLRNVVERTFGIWKNRFHILRGVLQYTVQKQRDVIIASTILHNFIKMFSNDDEFCNSDEDQQANESNDQDVEPSIQQQNDDENAIWDFRDYVAEFMWTNQ